MKIRDSLKKFNKGIGRFGKTEKDHKIEEILRISTLNCLICIFCVFETVLLFFFGLFRSCQM